MRKQTLTKYNLMYPGKTEEWFLKQISEFEKVFIEGGIITEMSSSYSKYLRGWLVARHNDNKCNHSDWSTSEIINHLRAINKELKDDLFKLTSDF